MAKPSPRPAAIEKLLNKVSGSNREACIKGNKCTQCGKDANKFKDEQSKIDFTIVGMCQLCQDNFYE